MAMTRAEMERHRDIYRALVSKSASLVTAGLICDSVEHAVAALDYVDGMMQYMRKYEKKDFETVGAVDFLLDLAPVVLDLESLEKVDALLKAQRRVEKNTAADLRRQLDDARVMLWRVHRLWDELEQRGDSRSHELQRLLELEDNQWRRVFEIWEKMGLIRHSGEGREQRISLVMCMSELAMAKCPSCGVVAKAPKSKLLDEVICPKCRSKATFVFLARAPSKAK